MRRREAAELAYSLHSELEKLAIDYRQRDDNRYREKTLDQWQVTAAKLVNFMVEMHDLQDESERTMGGLWLTRDLHDFIKSTKDGLPTVADHVPKAVGEKLDFGTQHDLVLCSLAITCLIKAGNKKEHAARRVATVMMKAGMQFPPRRSKTTQDWQTLDNWRDTLTAGKKGNYSLKEYQFKLASLRFTTQAEWQSYADDLLNMFVEVHQNR